MTNYDSGEQRSDGAAVRHGACPEATGAKKARHFSAAKESTFFGAVSVVLVGLCYVVFALQHTYVTPEFPDRFSLWVLFMILTGVAGLAFIVATFSLANRAGRPLALIAAVGLAGPPVLLLFSVVAFAAGSR